MLPSLSAPDRGLWAVDAVGGPVGCREANDLAAVRYSAGGARRVARLPLLTLVALTPGAAPFVRSRLVAKDEALVPCQHHRRVRAWARRGSVVAPSSTCLFEIGRGPCPRVWACSLSLAGWGAMDIRGPLVIEGRYYDTPSLPNVQYPPCGRMACEAGRVTTVRAGVEGIRRNTRCTRGGWVSGGEEDQLRHDKNIPVKAHCVV